ncbi:hypothetical protein ACFWY5_54585 [Nonomuraea sp. NPDC059007]|uniref:hypothetical protein n=1 Tax=Nonomuraea sp. NPDC059007 TaxID=3346692 RepID=UPI003693A195
MTSRLSLLVSVVLLLPAVSSCSKGWTNSEVGTCFTTRGYDVVDCSSPDAGRKLLGILEGPSLSVGDCPNRTSVMREYDGKGFCIGSP